MPFSFVICTNDSGTLNRRLLASPLFASEHEHQLITVWGAASAAEGVAHGRALARHPWVVFVHQDVVLPLGWDARFASRLREAQARFPALAVVGLYGVTDDGREAGHVDDRSVILRPPEPLPAAVSSLDELLFAFPRDLDLALDPALGYHLYATDLVLAARLRGLQAVVVDAPCAHLSTLPRVPPFPRAMLEAFLASSRVFERKWEAAFPLTTPCIRFDLGGSASRELGRLLEGAI